MSIEILLILVSESRWLSAQKKIFSSMCPETVPLLNFQTRLINSFWINKLTILFRTYANASSRKILDMTTLVILLSLKLMNSWNCFVRFNWFWFYGLLLKTQFSRLEKRIQNEIKLYESNLNYWIVGNGSRFKRLVLIH